MTATPRHNGDTPDEADRRASPFKEDVRVTYDDGGPRFGTIVRILRETALVLEDGGSREWVAVGRLVLA